MDDFQGLKTLVEEVTSDVVEITKVKIVEITIQVLEYYINLVDKAVPVCKRTDSNFERGSTVGKMLLNSVTCYREIVWDRKSQPTLLLSYFKKLPQPPKPSAITILTSQKPSTSRQKEYDA
ncbi:hypothetical protein QTO34_003022 [Cnephaeus nilssonii]|uniref:Uncharacterized protein n=1 Tax=Cnephaeus nilssonii TaxID=3371016 RepID=A0AA40HU27_CNENI|nr:hypothetical protein QTO34_003022 [Eptesicus nilssonii]